jgi:hypothetical protein
MEKCEGGEDVACIGFGFQSGGKLITIEAERVSRAYLERVREAACEITVLQRLSMVSRTCRSS